MKPDLNRVTRAASNLEAARSERDDAIRAAYSDGATLRVIAEAVGLSEMRVSQIVRHTR